jgi:hypothetical protein
MIDRELHHIRAIWAASVVTVKRDRA